MTIEMLLELEKRAIKDLMNDTHNIGQEEVLTLIRELILLTLEEREC